MFFFKKGNLFSCMLVFRGELTNAREIIDSVRPASVFEMVVDPAQ